MATSTLNDRKCRNTMKSFTMQLGNTSRAARHLTLNPNPSISCHHGSGHQKDRQRCKRQSGDFGSPSPAVMSEFQTIEVPLRRSHILPGATRKARGGGAGTGDAAERGERAASVQERRSALSSGAHQQTKAELSLQPSIS